MNKKSLAVLLSKLKIFEKPEVNLEQYTTEAELASGILWDIYLKKDIQDKVIADLGCGTGILGLGALILGAKKAYLVDVDKSALSIARKNKEFLERELDLELSAEFISKNIEDFNKKVDVVLQNPPFGVKRIHADKAFLLKAMGIADSVYSLHKIESAEFIEKLAMDNGFVIKKVDRISFPLRKVFGFHRKKRHFVDIGVWHIKKKV